nr:MAG TPA: tail tape measure protein [Caudoviricetes sp.]
MAGVEFKIKDAIDPNIVKKLEEIRNNIQTTSSEYADFTKKLSEGINFKPGNLKEYQSKVNSYNATITKLYASQNRLSELQTGQLKLLTDISRKIELLTKPLNTLADKITEVKVNLRGASEDLKNVSQDAGTASVSFQEASKKISMTAADFDSIRQTVKAFDAQAAELNSRLSDNKETISALRTSLRDLSKEYKTGAISEEEYKSKRDAIVSQLRTLTEQNKQYSAILRNHAQVAISTTGSYNEMKASMLQLEKEYYNLSQAAREGAKGMDILNNIGKLNQQLKDIDAQMGNYQRNVGNYASGWNGLNVSIQQIARELPALSVGANTFFLAISNNLPMFVDELKKARVEYELLKKSGQTATPVFKQVLGSLFSWQTALVVGITLLSSYGGEITKWVGSLFDARKEIDYLKQLQEDLNKSQKEGVKNAQDEAVKLDILYRAAVNLNKPMGERKKAVEELKKQYPSYFKNISDENILAGKAADSYQRLSNAILASAKARAVQDRLVEQAKQKLDLEEKLADLESKREKAEARKRREEATLAKIPASAGEGYDFQARIVAKAQSNVESLDKEIGSLLNQLYQADKASKEIASSINIGDVTFDPHSADKASDDLMQYMKGIRSKMADLSVSLIEDEHQRNIAAIEKGYNDQIEAIKGYSEEENKLREMLAQERMQKIAKENEEYTKKLAEADEKRIEEKKKHTDEILRLEEEQSSLRIAATSTGYRELENIITANYAKGMMSRKEYDEAMRELEKQAANEQLQIQIDATEKMIEIAEASGVVSKQQIEMLRESIKAMEAEIGSINADDQVKKAEEQQDITRRNFEALKGYSSALKDLASDIDSPFAGIFDGMDKGFSIMSDKISGVWGELTDGEKIERTTEMWGAMVGGIGSMISSIYDRQIEAIEAEQEANEKAGEEEISRIEALEERGAITTEEAEARKRAAEDKTAQKNAELEKKKAALRTKQAKFEKATSIAEAAIQIAGGILQTIKQLGFPAAIPMIAALGAMGAIQLATIIATPIPKYAKGTDSHKGGLAVVGDGGVPETIVIDKGAYITPSVPTLVDIPKGAKVIPYAVDMDRIKAHANDFDGLMAYRSENDLPPVSIVNDYSELEKKIGHLEKSQQIGFAKLAKAIRENNYQQFSKKI